MWAKAWKWLLTGAAVIIGLAVAYFAGNERNKSATDAAVDAAKADDAVKNAQTQANAAHDKAVQMAVASASASKDTQAERQKLGAGHVDTKEIDDLLRRAGILK